MTVASEISRNEYTGNGITTVFPYTFRVLRAADLFVSPIAGVDQALTTHYSVSNVGAQGGGNVTFVTAPPAGVDFAFTRDGMADTQLSDYVENAPVLAENLERDLDKLVMLIQRVREHLGRAVLLETDSQHEGLTLPDPQAGFYLRWKPDLSGLENAGAPTPSPTPDDDVTSGAIALYVDSATGDDANDGALATPVLTPQRAWDLIPRHVEHAVTIQLQNTGAAKFRSLLACGGKVVGQNGSITVKGVQVTHLSSQTATGGSLTTLVKAGAGWTVNEHRGRWVEATAGPGSGEEPKPIISNTATILTTACWQVPPTGATVFRIFSCPVTITASDDDVTATRPYAMTVRRQAGLFVQDLTIEFGTISPAFILEGAIVEMRRVRIRKGVGTGCLVYQQAALFHYSCLFSENAGYGLNADLDTWCHGHTTASFGNGSGAQAGFLLEGPGGFYLCHANDEDNGFVIFNAGGYAHLQLCAATSCSVAGIDVAHGAVAIVDGGVVDSNVTGILTRTGGTAVLTNDNGTLTVSNNSTAGITRHSGGRIIELVPPTLTVNGVDKNYGPEVLLESLAFGSTAAVAANGVDGGILMLTGINASFAVPAGKLMLVYWIEGLAVTGAAAGTYTVDFAVRRITAGTSSILATATGPAATRIGARGAGSFGGPMTILPGNEVWHLEVRNRNTSPGALAAGPHGVRIGFSYE